jgi:hypothetical protein
VRTEIQQHGFLEPLIHGPLAVTLFGDARRSRVEQLDALLDRVAQGGRGVFRGEVGAALERLVDGGGERSQVGH